jgi:hypothetical protein
MLFALVGLLDAMGANCSYLDFSMGFGCSISVAMLMRTVLLCKRPP